MGGGSPFPVAGVGSVEAETVVDGVKNSVVLKDVLFVPEMSCNLLSVPRCRANQLRYIFGSTEQGSGICFAENRNTHEKIFMGIQRSDNCLFEAILRPNSTAAQGITARLDNIALWHRRLGHTSEQTMRHTIPMV